MPLPNEMDEEIESAIDRALFHNEALTHIRIRNGRRNANGASMANMHQNASAEMAVRHHVIII